MSDFTRYAQDVLHTNDAGEWTLPSRSVYKHQWLWDSCFIAMGLAVYSPERAAQELVSLLRGQWSNGMLPHMIFSPQPGRPDDSRLWKSKRVSRYAPRDVWTSGITQPPIVADATQRVANALPTEKRQAFLETMVPALINHHAWLYRERDPDHTGLVTLFHPWESLDNTPSWLCDSRHIHTPRWIKLIHTLHATQLLNVFRTDVSHSSNGERASPRDVLKMYHTANALKKRRYNWSVVFQDPHYAIQSLSFNSMLIRNNQILRELCDQSNIQFPSDLEIAMSRATEALETLWDNEQEEYFHRDYVNGQLVPISTISTLIALYSGVVPKHKVSQLISKLHNPQLFQSKYIIPTVPLNSPQFNPHRYWQGPVWLNTNWLIYDGLKRVGLSHEATLVRDSSMHLFEQWGSYEYFSPLDGSGRGIHDFSWTAALYIVFANEVN